MPGRKAKTLAEQKRKNRRSKMTPERIKHILDLISKGVSYDRAGIAAGLGKGVVKEWLLIGRDPEYKTDQYSDYHRNKCKTFADKLEQAVNQDLQPVEELLRTNVVKSDNPVHQIGYLKLKDKRYSTKLEVEHKGKIDHEHTLTLSEAIEVLQDVDQQ